MAEEAQTEIPVQAAEEPPVAEEPIVEAPVAEIAAEPAAETAEVVAEAAEDAEQGDAGQKRSREEEEGADGEEPEAKRAAAEPAADENGGVDAEAQPAVDAFAAQPDVQPVENGADNPGYYDNPGTHEAPAIPVYGNPDHSMESNPGSNGPPPVRDGYPVVQNEDGSISETLAVSKHLVGKLIGKGGTTIQQLQGTTATNVQIDQEGSDLGPDVKKVTIRGRADNVAKCKESIKQMLEEAVAPQEGEVEDRVPCPAGIVGRVIGRGGETIRSLQQGSGAHILVDQNFPEGADRMVVIKGRPDCVSRARAMVEELIKGEPGSASQIISKHGLGVTLTVQCPKGIVGRIIGKGGETIKGLQRKYHVSIQIDQGGDPMNVTITGPKQTAEYCKQEVQSLIADPGPPFGGAGPRGGPGGYGGPRPYGAPYGGPAPYAPPPAYGGYAPPYGAPYGAPYAAPAYPGYPPAASPYAAGGYGAAAGYGGAYGGAAGYPAAQPAAAGGYAQPAGGYGTSTSPAAAGGYGQQQYGDAGAAAGGYAQQAPASTGAPAGGSVWQAMSDDQGRTYYYNTQTGVSQWEKPAEMP
jgi:far upstream element-binding protein